MNLERFRELKDRIDKLTRQKEQAAGAYKETMKTIKGKFECKTLEEAEELLKSLKEREQEEAEEYEAELEKFKAKWDSVL